MEQQFKPLDIVMTKSRAIAIVTECHIKENGKQELSLTYLDYFNKMPTTEKNAWWSNEIFSNTKDTLDDLILLDSIPRILAGLIAHSFGSNRNQGNIYFPLKREQ